MDELIYYFQFNKYCAKQEAARVPGWLFKPTAFNHHYNEAAQ
jgi:hypothetical protein